MALGGMRTLYGAIVGATLFMVAQACLQDVMAVVSGATGKVPLLSNVVHPARWLLWLSILCVYYLPQGIVDSLRDRAKR